MMQVRRGSTSGWLATQNSCNVSRMRRAVRGFAAVQGFSWPVDHVVSVPNGEAVCCKFAELPVLPRPGLPGRLWGRVYAGNILLFHKGNISYAACHGGVACKQVFIGKFLNARRLRQQ